jgi:hypothetical protein
VQATDTALYAAKRAGRNRVRVGAVPGPGADLGMIPGQVAEAAEPVVPGVFVPFPPPLPPAP